MVPDYILQLYGMSDRLSHTDYSPRRPDSQDTLILCLLPKTHRPIVLLSAEGNHVFIISLRHYRTSLLYHGVRDNTCRNYHYRMGMYAAAQDSKTYIAVFLCNTRGAIVSIAISIHTATDTRSVAYTLDMLSCW